MVAISRCIYRGIYMVVLRSTIAAKLINIDKTPIKVVYLSVLVLSITIEQSIQYMNTTVVLIYRYYRIWPATRGNRPPKILNNFSEPRPLARRNYQG